MLRRPGQKTTNILLLLTYKDARKARVINQSAVQTLLDYIHVDFSGAPDNGQNAAIEISCVKQARGGASRLLRLTIYGGDSVDGLKSLGCHW